MKIRKDVVAPVLILIGVGLFFIMVFLRDMGIIKSRKDGSWNFNSWDSMGFISKFCIL